MSGYTLQKLYFQFLIRRLITVKITVKDTVSEAEPHDRSKITPETSLFEKLSFLCLKPLMIGIFLFHSFKNKNGQAQDWAPAR